MASLITLCPTAGHVNAQQEPPAPALWTVDQAVDEALQKNIGLIAEKLNIPIADARVIQARLRPNPVFSYGQDYQDVLGSGFYNKPATGAGPPEWNVRVDLPIERGAKRQKRIDLAEHQLSVAQLQLLNTTRQLVFEVRSACVDVYLARESIKLAQENLKALNGIVEINSARVRSGDLAEVELLRSQVAEQQFENAVRQGELRLQTARDRLRFLLGRTDDSDTPDVAGPLRRDPIAVKLEDLRDDALKFRPDMQALLKDQARSQADLRLQLAQGKVDFSIGTEYHHQYGYALGNALGFFFSVPIPLFNRNQGEIVRAQREEQQIRSRIRALEASIRSEVMVGYQQYATGRALLDKMESGMLDQARRVRDITEYSYRRGEASLVEFLDAQRAFNDTTQSYNEARAEYARTLYLLDSVAGRKVNP